MLLLMSFTQSNLKNGAKVVLAPFSGTDAAAILVAFQIGSRNETDNVWGGSHFVEHLMFKGTTRRPQTLDISKELDRYGAQYNAYTGKDLTGYWVKIAGEQLPVAVDLLNDMIFHSAFNAEEMEREKNVIVEEIKMYEENPIMHIEDLLEEAMFDGHILGKNIAGTAKSMLAMKRQDVVNYHHEYYAPENMVIVMAGKVPKNAMKMIENRFGKIAKKEVKRLDEPFAAIASAKTVRVRIQNKPVEQVQVAMGFPTPGRAHKDMEALKLLSTILGGTMSSRLFIEVREKRGLCYHVRAIVDGYDDVGVFAIRAGLDAKRLKEASKVIRAEIAKVVKNGVTAKELAMAKDNVRGAMMLQLEDSSASAEFVGRQELFLKEASTAQERMARFDAVTRADILRAAREVLDVKQLSVAGIGPFASEEAFLKEL